MLVVGLIVKMVVATINADIIKPTHFECIILYFSLWRLLCLDYHKNQEKAYIKNRQLLTWKAIIICDNSFLTCSLTQMRH
jgi:hypothetical protein